MAAIKGAAKLGTAIVKHLEVLGPDLDLTDDGRIAKTPHNHNTVRWALLEAMRDVGAMPLWVFTLSTLQPLPEPGQAD